MGKSFLITEQEKRNILSLYRNKGLLSEQDTTREMMGTGVTMYVLSPYYLSVKDNNMTIATPNGDGTYTNSEYTASGDLNNLKFNLFDMTFESPNMWAIEGDLRTITKETTSGYVVSKILENTSNLNVKNELGYVVALNNNGIPQLFPIMIRIVPMANGNAPGQSVLSESEIVGVNTVYTPQNKSDFESLKSILSKYTYRDTGARTVQASSQNYAEMDFRDFRNNWAVGISLRKGPEGFVPDTKDNYDEEFAPRNIGGGKTDPFVFNSTELSDNGLELLETFANQFIFAKKNKGDLYQKYINFLNGKTKNIQVFAYSSIDDNPEETIQYVVGKNAVEGCGGTMKRKDYNQCLSQKRADKIASILNEKLPDFPDFIGKGMGETDKFAPGKKWPKSSRDETLPNRRFEVNLPEYQDMVKVK
jgi:hypothetical protein